MEWHLVADTVEKVENRTTLKILRKSMFSRLYRCNPRWGRYEGPWSFLLKSVVAPHVAARETHQRS